MYVWLCQQNERLTETGITTRDFMQFWIAHKTKNLQRTPYWVKILNWFHCPSAMLQASMPTLRWLPNACLDPLHCCGSCTTKNNLKISDSWSSPPWSEVWWVTKHSIFHRVSKNSYKSHSIQFLLFRSVQLSDSSIWVVGCRLKTVQSVSLLVSSQYQPQVLISFFCRHNGSKKWH